jgi:hypothetical protein
MKETSLKRKGIVTIELVVSIVIVIALVVIFITLITAFKNPPGGVGSGIIERIGEIFR